MALNLVDVLAHGAGAKIGSYLSFKDSNRNLMLETNLIRAYLPFRIDEEWRNKTHDHPFFENWDAKKLSMVLHLVEDKGNTEMLGVGAFIYCMLLLRCGPGHAADLLRTTIPELWNEANPVLERMRSLSESRIDIVVS